MALLKHMVNYQVRLTATFHALSDPTRRAMLARLSQGPASVSELASPHRISLPAILQHLKELEQSGLVRSEKRGRSRFCRIEPQVLDQAERWLAERRAEWEAHLDRFEDYVTTLKNAGEA